MGRGFHTWLETPCIDIMAEIDSKRSSSAWINEPDGRGTWGLIQSCLNTLVLCAYTAVHLNIQPNQSERQAWFRRVMATFLTMILPELVLVSAMAQYHCARGLQRRLNNMDQLVRLSYMSYGRLGLLISHIFSIMIVLDVREIATCRVGQGQERKIDASRIERRLAP